MTKLVKNRYLERTLPDGSIKYYVINALNDNESYKVMEAIEGEEGIKDLTFDELRSTNSQVRVITELSDTLSSYLDLIDNDILWSFTQNYLDKVDPSFWIKPASSTGKYHSEVENGVGGLYRHTVRVTEMMIRLMNAENVSIKDRDCGIVAALLHDSCKYESLESKYTRFEHPIIAADLIRSYSLDSKYSSISNFLNKIADMVASHSGRFTTSCYSEAVLPKPKTKLQKLLHYADMIASGKYSY